jgi:hypothetical protein
MSIVSAFAAAAAAQVFPAFGTETISIGGGTAVACVTAEIQDSSELMEYGQDPGVALTMVCRRATFDAAYPLASQSYLRKTATAAGREMRVAGIDRGRDFVMIRLAGKEKA